MKLNLIGYISIGNIYKYNKGTLQFNNHKIKKKIFRRKQLFFFIHQLISQVQILFNFDPL